MRDALAPGMGKRSSVRSRSWAGAALCIPLVLGPLLTACDPSDFDALTRRPDAATGGSAGRDAEPDGGEAGEAGGDAGREGGAGSTASMDAGPDAAAPIADAGMDAATEGGDAATDAAPPGCPRAADPDAVGIDVTDLGLIEVAGVDYPGPVLSARVGPHMLWLFNKPGIAAWGDPEPPPTAPELEVPLPILPLLPNGAVPNTATPVLNGAVAVSDDEALIFFGSGVFFNVDDIGLARIAFDGVQAELVHPAGELFPYRQTTGGAPRIWIPLFGTGVFTHEEPDGTYVYVYACNANPDAPDEQPGAVHDGPCRLARVPRELATDGASYRYWNGSSWVSDHRAASIVLDHVPSALTVSFNRYLQKFLAVHSHGLADRILLRWADRPEGPWHELASFDTMKTTAEFPFAIINGTEHPGLRDACAKTLYVSYLLPLLVASPAGEETILEARLVQIDLQ